MLNPSATTVARIDWFPAERLGQAKIEIAVRHWLIGQGLLTERLKAVCGDLFCLRLVEQSTVILSDEQREALAARDTAGLLREVEMSCGGKVWVFAQTIIPDSTLNRHSWLSELGDAALGETLSALSGVERSSYEYAWLPVSDPLAARALRGADLTPAGLWSRRVRFTLHGAPLLVQEVFMPSVGQL
jgi:chorismate--pyruvate lyase